MLRASSAYRVASALQDGRQSLPESRALFLGGLVGGMQFLGRGR